jgi:hypothetical protein
MVRLSDFNKIIYKRPRLFQYGKSLEKIIGFDSEAYKDGSTFLFTTSLGDVFTPDTILDYLFSDTYAKANFVTWNLKYESGAILKVFPLKIIKRMQTHHEVSFTHKKYKYSLSYLPHKYFRLKRDNIVVRFWDIAPFYGRMKLESAASDYLQSHKLKGMNPQKFTREYVRIHFDEIVTYCIQDSVLTRKLADLWISTFEQTGILVSSLYSEASISFAYISRKADIVTPWEYWEHNRKLIRYAFESYEGGKFEVTVRGKFTGYEYDISSAYPYHISNLVDIRNATVIYSKQYQKSATYGYLRVKIHVDNPDIHLPCGIFKKLRIYPIGTYYLTITKQEYDYMRNELQVDVQIIDGAWIIVSRRLYPYRAVMKELYDQKQYWKSKDKQRSHNFKIVMNGFYGKMAQCIHTPEGTYLAGSGWNPLYSSVITANTRIQVTRLQNILKKSCLAVHTDSVISTRKIPRRFLGKELGKFELVTHGKGIIVACGIYEINGQSALKGFRVMREECPITLTELMQENPNKKKIKLLMRHVESWTQAMAHNHEADTINVFDEEFPKDLTINCDTKRQWPCDMTTTDILNHRQRSTPLLEYQEQKPSYWKE